MTERTLELALLLSREAECSGCVDEVGRELGRVAGVHSIDADVLRGLVTVSYNEDELGPEELETCARRAGAQAHCYEHCPLAVHDHGQLDLRIPLSSEDGAQRRILHVIGMDCADCAAKLQSALRRERGVRGADVNFGAATLAVVIDASQIDLPAVYTAVRRLGYDTLERRASEAAARPGGHITTAVVPDQGRRWPRERRAQLIVVSGLLVVAGLAAQAAASSIAPWFFVLAMIAGGAYIARAAFFSLRARQVDMNVLMTLAALGAVAIGEWAEAALVVFLFGLGTALQAATLERTRRAIRSLMELTPPTVMVLLEGAEVTKPVSEVVVGDVVHVRPGERLAVDGVVLEGHASANQAPITGESAPVAKRPGDGVFAGSIVEGGSLRVRATTAAADNTIAKIVHLVEEAQAKRAPSQAIVDRFAARYTPIVVALAAAVAFVPPLFGQPFDVWFYRGLAVLIISCPCALVISTPVSILAALGRATRSGVLIKGGVYLEQAAKIRAIAFDKTGTLTSGRPQVTDVIGLRGVGEERVLLLAAAVERFSEHPLARAIVEASAPMPSAPVVVERFRAIVGKGVRAEVDGRLLFVGRPDLLGAEGEEPVLAAAVGRLERAGKTVVVLGDEHGGLGVIAVSDPLRPGTAAAIRRLRALGVEHVAMLTGDNPGTAAAIAGQAGISDVRAGLLPADKVADAAELRDRYGTMAMVGDGVNDAPALATASLGIAMGAAGTDAALDSADIVLMGNDLAAVPETIRLARRTTRTIWQNIVFSIAVKSVFLVLAPLGLVTLWMAVFADMGTSLLVTANGLRLFRRERPDKGGS
ncbi:MAG TPA: heavy metal translocating P-type ATPase [Thermoleophilia bacterium]|nr:heavy metal translocating P-type ATPase [Thermoleophilia bacterium]